MSTRPLPCALPLRQALDQSAPLARLVQRVRESQQRFAHIEPLLPPALRRGVKPGPLDAEGWTLLVANAAIAAKMRHLLPLLVQRLAEGGWPSLPLRVKLDNAPG